ncbi:MAG: SGNH/GDSL hydrolase family protein [Erythrobacter sp.]|nr:MAG: SGNH/GDSL hydrolase family protein [Erythrobacter sp.]
MSRHVVLIGDSLFDNTAYVDGGPDVAAQLREILQPDDRVTLAAVDGSICEHAVEQLGRCPKDATHVIVSCGGNDILHHATMLEKPVSTVGSGLALLAEARAELEPAHRQMVEAAALLERPVAICTIYDANMGPLITTAMSIFNDAISRNVHRANLDLIDLRLVCTEPADYANPIEPSVVGGWKIAQAIAHYVRSTDAKSAQTRVFAGSPLIS